METEQNDYDFRLPLINRFLRKLWKFYSRLSNVTDFLLPRVHSLFFCFVKSDKNIDWPKVEEIEVLHVS